MSKRASAEEEEASVEEDADGEESASAASKEGASAAIAGTTSSVAKNRNLHILGQKGEHLCNATDKKAAFHSLAFEGSRAKPFPDETPRESKGEIFIGDCEEDGEAHGEGPGIMQDLKDLVDERPQGDVSGSGRDSTLLCPEDSSSRGVDGVSILVIV